MNEPQKAKLIVLATSHQFQGEKFTMSIDDPCYRQIVKYLIDFKALQFVFEEAAGHSPTYAEKIAKDRAKEIGYLDVDPSRSEREEYGLPEETGEGLMVDIWAQPPCIAHSEFVERHAAREKFWLKRIKSESFSSALMICGCAHGLSFSFRLREAGFDVETCINYFPPEKLCGHQ
jgi:hypothetical protein